MDYDKVIIGISWLMIILLGGLLFLYKSLYNDYKIKHKNLLDEQLGNKRAQSDKRDELINEILILKSLINKLIFIIKGKPALLAKEKLRFTFSIRANGKRVARVRPDNNKDTRPNTIIGEPMVQISKDTYIKESQLHHILKSSGTDVHLNMENRINELKQYNI